MKTTKVSTRFMSGNLDVEGVIYDLLIDEYGFVAVIEHDIDFNLAIYSDNFITAIEEGLIPDLNRIEDASAPVMFGEYHHMIFNDECYKVYFK